MNLNNPVPGGGAVPLGIVTIRGDNLLYTSWERVGNLARSLLNIPVGQTVPAGQINVSFHLNGRFHVLQMGPQPLGHCHQGTDSTRVHGAGTSAGTIHRASQSKWVVDLPAGSLREVDSLRFRKALVSERSNDYHHHDLPLPEWAADRERTVFIVSPSGVNRFLSGFRAFHLQDGKEYPPEFLNPPPR